MKQNFNFSRAFLLLKATVIANKRVVIISLAILTVLFLIFFAHNISTNERDPLYSFIGLTLIMGLIMPIISFFELHRKKEYIITSYMVPASTKEKFFTTICMSFIAFSVIFLLYLTLASICWSIASLITMSGVDYNRFTQPILANLELNTILIYPLIIFCYSLTRNKYYNIFLSLLLSSVFLIAFKFEHNPWSDFSTYYLELIISTLFLIPAYYLFRQIQSNNLS